MNHKPDSPTNIGEYKRILNELRKGGYVSVLDPVNERKQLSNANPDPGILFQEREACETIILEAFFQSRIFRDWKGKAFEKAIDREDDRRLRGGDFTSIQVIASQIIKHYAEFITFEENTEGPLSNSIKILALHNKLNGTDFMKGGIGTANSFAIKMMWVFSGMRNRITNLDHAHNRKTPIDNKLLAKTIRSTLVTQGTFFGSFLLADHAASLLLLSGKEDIKKVAGIPLGFLTDFGYSFEGDITSGKPLKPKKEIYNALRRLMEESKGAIRCPAINAKTPGGTGMQIYMKFLADLYILNAGILTLEELQDLDSEN